MLPPDLRRGSHHAFLTLLTLDLRVNRVNHPVFVNLTFSNEQATSLSPPPAPFEFRCWDRVRLRRIDTRLNETDFGSRKGLVESLSAAKVDTGVGINDTAGPVTLLAIVETTERNLNDTAWVREYSYSMHNDGVPLPTTFAIP